LHPNGFDRGGNDPYHTRAVVGGPPDLVDCESLAVARETLERVYELGELPRLQDLLADRRGLLRAAFEFARADSGRSGAIIAIEAAPRLVCQRCLEGFEFRVVARSEIEFVTGRVAGPLDSARELYRSDQGLVSLRELAEEELLLALPLAPACSSPVLCGNAPVYVAADDAAPMAEATARPFAALRDLLKKHDRT
jgi:uncharacterized protein